MKGPRKPATCMMRGLLHKSTSCDIANSAENCWRFSLSLLSRSTCNGVYVIHSFMSFQLSLQTINICELSQCAAFLEGAPPSWHKQKVYSTSACDLKGKQSQTSISPNMRVTIMHSCSFLCDAGRLNIGFSDFDSQLQKRLRRSQSSKQTQLPPHRRPCRIPRHLPEKTVMWMEILSINLTFSLWHLMKPWIGGWDSRFSSILSFSLQHVQPRIPGFYM